MHARKHQAVRDDFLHLLEDIKALGEQYGFAVLAQKNDEKIFYILIKKTKKQ